MQIVLATPPAEGNHWGVGSLPTLGLAYLAASVKRILGTQITVVDGFAEGLDVDQATQRVLSVEPAMLGVTVTSLNISRGLRLIRSVKKRRPDIITIMGGHHATVFDSLLLREVPELDFILRGEAEGSFPELCDRLVRSQDVAGVDGLTYRSDGTVVRGQPQMVHDLDSIPFPDREVFSYKRYGTQWAGFYIPPILSGIMATMIASRGCPYHCTFCAKTTPQLSNYRARSAENVFSEVLELADKGYKAVGFVDENFSHDVKMIKKLCNMILAKNLPMRFFFQGSLHHLSRSVLDLMHEAGFDLVMVGVESGSDAQLKRYNKPVGRDALAAGIRRAKKAHLFVVGFFIDGAPHESEEDHQATLDFIKEVRPHICATGELAVHPGSRLWDDMIGPGESEESLDWSRTRMIHTLDGQLDKEAIDRRIRAFQRAFSRSWLNWRRIGDLVDLLIHNPSIRKVLSSVYRYPRTVLQLLSR